MTLTQRQKEILKKLISNDFVSTDELLDTFGISINTIKNDIDRINDEISPKSHICCNTNEQYYLDNKDLFIQDEYFLSDTLLYDNQTRFNQIYGYILEHQYTKLEDLENVLSLERSTFLPYLKLVKKQFKQFDIDLLSKPKYGYYLRYNEINYRYAYVFYLTLTKYPVETDNSIYRQLTKDIKDKNLEINDTKFTQLYYYLKTKQDRVNRGCVLEDESKQYEEILEILNLKEKEYQNLVIENSIDELRFSFENYLNEHNLLFLIKECHFSLFDFVIKSKLKREYKIYLNIIPNQLDSISRESPVSLFLAKQILDFIKDYDESSTYELANILYNEIVTRHYAYQKLKLLIVSTLDKSSHSSLIYRLNNRYSNYIDSIGSAYFYELSKELVNQYDAVIYFQKDGMILPSYVKKKYALEYFINYNDFSNMFEELIVPHFIYSNPFDFNHKIEKVLFNDLDELKKYQVEIYNQLGITIVFTNKEPKTIYYSFASMKKLNNRKIREGFIFILNTNENILSLKMAEHLIRLVTQSRNAKDYLLQGVGDIYSNLLHQRKQFVR